MKKKACFTYKCLQNPIKFLKLAFSYLLKVKKAILFKNNLSSILNYSIYKIC